MKADHILVVMDGEIIEEGTHQDLIQARGKYHELWSKQIFVKPSSERSRSRSPQKRDTNIINDLSPEKQKAEMIKAKAAPENNTDKDKKSDDGKKGEIGHQREVSPGDD